jgi:hypothetical protein
VELDPDGSGAGLVLYKEWIAAEDINQLFKKHGVPTTAQTAHAAQTAQTAHQQNLQRQRQSGVQQAERLGRSSEAGERAGKKRAQDLLLLSVDIDYNDYWVWAAVDPRQYNPAIGENY